MAEYPDPGVAVFVVRRADVLCVHTYAVCSFLTALLLVAWTLLLASVRLPWKLPFSRFGVLPNADVDLRTTQAMLADVPVVKQCRLVRRTASCSSPYRTYLGR